MIECPRLSDEQNLQNANVAQMYLSHDVHRVINVWNDMPTDTVDFTSLTNVKKSIMRVDITARLKCFP